MKNYFAVASLATLRYRLKFNLCSCTVKKKLQQFVPVHGFSIQSNQQCVTDFMTKVGDGEIRCFVFINYQLDLDERRVQERRGEERSCLVTADQFILLLLLL